MVSKVCKGSIPIAITIQGSSMDEYLKLIDIAKNNEADWIILQPLTKVNATDKDCYNFFKKLIPFVGDTLVGVKNAKEYLGVGLSAEDIMKLYKKFDNFRVLKGEASSIVLQNEILKYPKDLIVFNGRGGQEIIDNFLVGFKGIIPALDNADKLIKIYKYIKNQELEKAHKEYIKILPSIVFVMQSINSLVCYGKRICAYRMGIKNIYDRSPGMIPTSYGLKKVKQISKDLGSF